MSKSKYVVIGGVPYQDTSGTTTYTALVKVGEYETLRLAEIAMEERRNACGGLIEIFAVGDEKCTGTTLTSSR